MTTRTVVKVRLENPRFDRLFFRELTLDGKKVFVYAGTQQRLSETETRPERVFEQYGVRHPTEAAARASFEKQAEEGKKGWQKFARTESQVAGAGDEGLAPAASNPALEGPLRTAAEPAQAARVYADWLQSQGDLRGELAALIQGGRQADADAFLAANANRLLGDLDVALGGGVSGLEWTHGFLTGARLKIRPDADDALDALTAAFLALPLARFVTRLRFGLAGFESDNDWTSTLAAVTASPRAAQITALHFTEYTSEDCEISWTPFGDFSAAWTRLPALEELHIRSGQGGNLGALNLPSLKKFVRESGGLAREELDAIVAADWPKLQHLEIWTGREEYGAQGTVGSLARILDGQAAGSLTHLGIVNCEFTPDLIGPLAVSKVLPRLKSLDLSKGVLMDAEALELIRHRAAFAHLQRLDLSENLFNEAGPQLQQALPNAILTDQRYEEDDYRYTAVGE